MDRLESVFRDVFEDQKLDTEGLTRESFPDWDSFAQVKLVIGIEEQFHIKLSISEAAAISSVEGFRRLISEKTQA